MESVAVGDGDFQQLDHQADDLTRGEVIPGCLGMCFREAPEQFLVDVAHLQAGELVRAEVEVLNTDSGSARGGRSSPSCR